MRLILLLAVIALGADALMYNGSYTQAAWREASVQVERLLHEAEAKVSDAGRKT
jgi:hypothetical protein